MLPQLLKNFMKQNSEFSFKIQKKKNYHIVTLSSESLSAKIAPELGSNLFSLTYHEKDIIISDKKLLETYGFTGCFVLFPTPNRVRSFTYSWLGKKIPLKKHGNFVEIHGLVFTEPWKFTKPVVTKRGVSFKTSISVTKKSSLFEGFPFPCLLTLEYKLYSKGIKIIYTVKNTGSSDLPFGFALHPYFNRVSGNDKTYILVPARSWMESPSDTLLPTGKLIPVAGKPYDLRRPIALSKLQLDHVFTDLQPKKFAIIDYQTQHIKIHLLTSSDFTHTVVYTGEPRSVCIENQTCSTDAHNLWARGLKKESHLMIIKPDLSHTGYICYEVSSY
jgi:aldose 1-epimerase